jgi:hypothetical protein
MGHPVNITQVRLGFSFLLSCSCRIAKSGIAIGRAVADLAIIGPDLAIQAERMQS